MANITITNYISGCRLYGVIDSGGGSYTQTTDYASYLALLDDQPTGNGTYAGSILSTSSTLTDLDSTLDFDVVFTPEFAQTYSGQIDITSDANTESSAVTGTGLNPFNIAKRNYCLILERLTSQFKTGGA